MLEEGGTTYNTTAVDESSVRKIKPPRVLFAVLVGMTFCLVVGASWISRRHEEVFAKLEIRELPIPTEIVLRVAKFLTSPAGMAVSVFCIVTVILLALKGLLDRGLKLLIGLNAVLLLLFLFATYSTWQALIRIGKHLNAAP